MTPAASVVDAFAALADLARRRSDSERILSFEGAGHIVHDLPVRADGRTVSAASRPNHRDPIPYVIGAAEFDALAQAIASRMRMLERLISDLYGRRTLIASRLIDAEALFGSRRYRLAAVGAHPPRRWLTNYAVDVMRDDTGRWHVISDKTDAPGGLGDALLDRMVSDRIHADVTAGILTRCDAGSTAPRELDGFIGRVRDALADLTTNPSPRIVVMSPGVSSPSFVDQSYLAMRLGLNLAEGADLVVRKRRLWLRSLAGLEPIDVLFRRLDDDRLDPMEVNTDGGVGVPGLLLANNSKGVRLANAHGCGVIEDRSLTAQWDAAGEWLGFARPDEGAAPLASIGDDERRRTSWERVATLDGDATVDRRVIVRLHAVAGAGGIDVLPGGTARVLREPDRASDDPLDAAIESSKDVWVLGSSPAGAVPRPRVLPRVDLVASVPTRAAEALFWAGRALERAEIIARALRVVLDRFESSPIEGGAPETRWHHDAALTLAAVARSDDADIRSVAGALVRQIGSLLAEASSVREYFSVTAGRAFVRLAERRSEIENLLVLDDRDRPEPKFEGELASIGLLDGVLLDLASLHGLWNESVVRGPAWRIGEIGRRLERVLGVVDSLRTVATGSGEEDDRARLLEIVLATNESLVAYRRRFRSDVVVDDTFSLVVADDRNPRSVAAALAVVADEAQLLGWDDGARRASELHRRAWVADGRSLFEILDELSAGAFELVSDLIEAYLASPIDPHVMGVST